MVEVKIKNATDLTTLYSLNEWQKPSFATHVTFKIELIDTFSINIIYNIPTEIKLIMNFDPNSFNEEINEALSGKPAGCIILKKARNVLKQIENNLKGSLHYKSKSGGKL